MKIIVKYKGYYGVITFSPEDNLYVARVVGIGHSYISCHGVTIDKAKEEFKVSIDFHLEVSEAEGWAPCVTDPDVAREMEALLNAENGGSFQVTETHKQLAFAH